jgi:cell division protein FtsB
MAAIDDLKAQRLEVIDSIAAFADRRAVLVAARQKVFDDQSTRIAALDVRLATLRAQRDSLNLAIRDLTDGWNPV